MEEKLTFKLFEKLYNLTAKVQDKDKMKIYTKIIEQNFPGITNFTLNDYETISAEINEQLKNGQKVTAVEKFYNRTLTYLSILAKFYSNNNLDINNFEEDLNGLQFSFVEKLKTKVEVDKSWFKNYRTFISSMIKTASTYILHLCKDLEQEKLFAIQQLDKKSISLIYDNLYNKLIDDVTIEELRNELKISLKVLNKRDEKILSQIYLRQTKYTNTEDIAKCFNLTHQRIVQIRQKSINILKNSNPTHLKDFMEVIDS